MTSNISSCKRRILAQFHFDRFFCEIVVLGVVDFLMLRFFCKIDVLGVVDFVRWVWPRSLPIDSAVFRSMTFFVECQFFRWDHRCPLGGGVGVELLKWDFGSRLVPSGTALRSGKHGRDENGKRGHLFFGGLKTPRSTVTKHLLFFFH